MMDNGYARAAALAAALAAVNCVQTEFDEVRFESQAGVCRTQPTPLAPESLQMVDDFEIRDGDWKINGGEGQWIVAGDASRSGYLFAGTPPAPPPPERDETSVSTGVFMAPPETALLRDCPLGRRSYLYVFGYGFGEWGAHADLEFKASEWDAEAQSSVYHPVDLTAYEGIAFWARSPSWTDQVQVTFPTLDTSPNSGRCDGPGRNGCYNHFQTRVRLGPEWAYFVIPFASLRQDPNFGEMFPAFNAREVLAMSLSLIRGARFELWVDDVALIKKENR